MIDRILTMERNRHNGKRWIDILIVLFVFAAIYVSTTDFERKEILLTRAQADEIRNKTIKLILRWDDESSSDGDIRFRLCQYSNCMITKDKSLLKQSRAVLFQSFRLDKYLINQPERYPWQDWILYTREPPYAIRAVDQFDGKFNMIIHYNRDSDIEYGYGRFVPLTNSTDPARLPMKENFAENKTGVVAWIVSNCRPKSLRNKYVEELQKYIKVDIYGHCSNNSCGKKGVDEGKLACMKEIAERKFYLSFENQICPDYLTEKIWNAYELGTVPVVLGGADYKKLLVKNSYIDIKDFTEPKLLAEYLLSLNSDNKRYNRFFKWRNTHKINRMYDRWCNMCKHLNIHDKPIKVYPNLKSWFDRCVDPHIYYNGTANTIVKFVSHHPELLHQTPKPSKF